MLPNPHANDPQVEGGNFWDQVNGPAPKGWVWDQNGQPMKEPTWNKVDRIFEQGVMSAMTGGVGGAAMGAFGQGVYEFGPRAARPQGYQMAANPYSPYGGGTGGYGGSAPPWSGMPGAGGGGAPSPYAGYGGAQSGQPPAPGSYGTTPDTYFNDPLTQPIMAAWGSRMNQLQQQGPGYGDIEGILRGYLKPDPRFNNALDDLYSASKGPGASNAYTGQYAAATKKRMTQLNADPFSTADEAALKARFFDSMAGDRDAAYAANAAQMASRGLAPTSGVAQALGAETSAGYEKAKALQTQQMLQYVTDEANRRKDLGVQMSGALAQQGGQDAALAQQWQVARSGMLGNIMSALAQQQGIGMNAATTMASLRRQQYLDDQTRGDQLLQTSALPSALANQRMQQLQQTLAGQSNPQQMFQNQMAMAQLQAQIDAARRSGNMQLVAALTAMAGTIGGAYINSRGRGTTPRLGPPTTAAATRRGRGSTRARFDYGSAGGGYGGQIWT